MSRSIKPRKITIDGQIYFWRVDYFQYEGTAIKIWKDKKLIYNKETKESSVTPKIIANLIQNL
jgi:hypothetical protein